MQVRFLPGAYDHPMFRAKFLIFFSSLAVLACRTSAAPATRGATADDDKRQTRIESAAEANKFPSISVRSISDVISLKQVDEMLSAEMLLKNPPPMTRLKLPNSDIVATLQMFPHIGRNPGTSHGFSMMLRDFSPPGSMWIQTTLSTTDGRIQLSQDDESSTISESVQFIEDSPPVPGEAPPSIEPVRLYISRNNEITGQNEANIKLSAATFVALCRNNPTETQKYLRPICHDLGQEAAVFAPDPKAVWQALAEDWNPDAAIIGRVKEAIAKLEAEDFQARQSAGQSLRQMGEPAALMLMRMDRSQLSAAQNSEIDTFLAPYLPLSPAEVLRLALYHHAEPGDQ